MDLRRIAFNLPAWDSGVLKRKVLEAEDVHHQQLNQITDRSTEDISVGNRRKKKWYYFKLSLF